MGNQNGFAWEIKVVSHGKAKWLKIGPKNDRKRPPKSTWHSLPNAVEHFLFWLSIPPQNIFPRTIKTTSYGHPKPSPAHNQNNITRTPETTSRTQSKQHSADTRNHFPHTIKTTSRRHPEPLATGTAKRGQAPRCGSLPLALFGRHMPQAPPATAGLSAAA